MSRINNNHGQRNLIVGFSLFLVLSLALVLYERGGQPKWAREYLADKGHSARVLGENITEDGLTVSYRYNIRQLADMTDLPEMKNALLALSVPPVYRKLHLRLVGFLAAGREREEWERLRSEYAWLPAWFGPNL